MLAPLLRTPPGPRTDAAPLAGHVITLTHSWRAGSGLQRGIEALRDAPDPAWLDQLLAERADGDLHLRHCADTRHTARLRRSLDRRACRSAAALADARPSTPPMPCARLRQLQILCALRDGPFGAQGINDLLARRLAARFDIDCSQLGITAAR